MIHESKELGQLIRDIRSAANITAEELGIKAGISSTNITRFETGIIKNPSFETVYKLLKTIATLDIIKNDDFILDNYSEDVVSLLMTFINVDETEAQYRLNASSDKLGNIANNIKHISSGDLNFIDFYVKAKKHISIASKAALSLRTVIDNLNEDKRVNSVDDFNYYSYIQNLVATECRSESDKAILNKLFSSALTDPSEDSLFLLFSHWMEYMADMLPTVIDDL